jgi:tetratricopeptide (TPR) repeat protein
MPKVRAAAQRTLELDQSASLGHAMLGLVAGAFDYDWAEVDRRFGLAMAESPVPGLVRWPYANFCLAPRGRFREAAEQMESWLEEDPLNVTIRTELAFFLNHAGQHDRAAAAARLALEIDAGSWFAHYTMAEIHAAAGRFADAAAAAERAWSAAPWNPRVVGLLAGALARTGDRERSRQLLRGLEGARPVGMLMYHLLNPEIEAAALWWYERAIRQRELFTVLYARTPIGDPLRKLPGWGRLAAMMNLD